MVEHYRKGEEIESDHPQLRGGGSPGAYRRDRKSLRQLPARGSVSGSALIFALYIGWYSSPARGAICGIGFGLLQDAISGIYLGLNGLTKTLMGFGASYLSKWLLMEGLLARCVLIALLSLADDLLVVGMRALVGQTIQQEIWLRILIRVPVTGVAGGFSFLSMTGSSFLKRTFHSCKPYYAASEER